MGRAVSPGFLTNGFLLPLGRGPPLKVGLRFLGKSATASAVSTTNPSVSRLTLKSQNATGLEAEASLFYCEKTDTSP